MNNQTLVIYDFDTIYDILKEIENYLSFKIIKINKSKIDGLNINNQDNFLIISKKKVVQFENQIVIDKFPIEI